MRGASRVLFASDVHLDPDKPEISAAFFSFLEGPATSAKTLYLLGDIFDRWIGDDERFPLADEFAQRVGRLSAAGAEVFFMAGNHDFLLGEAMAERCGMGLLADEAAITLWGQKVLLLHGDTLCTDDEPYMRWRAYSRDPANIGKFLAMPLEERQRESRRIMEYNAAGREAAPSKPMVNLGTTAEAAARHGCDLMIHGHTHVPGRHEETSEAGGYTRIVMPAWTRGRGGYVMIDDGRAEIVKLGKA